MFVNDMLEADVLAGAVTRLASLLESVIDWIDLGGVELGDEVGRRLYPTRVVFI